MLFLSWSSSLSKPSKAPEESSFIRSGSFGWIVVAPLGLSDSLGLRAIALDTVGWRMSMLLGDFGDFNFKVLLGLEFLPFWTQLEGSLQERYLGLRSLGSSRHLDLVNLDYS